MRALVVICAFLLAAACVPAAALAQEKDPSALWDSFPLDPTPTPGSGQRTAAPPRAADNSDDGPSPFVLFGLMVLAAGVGGSAVLLTRTVRRGREEPASEPAPAATASAARINGTPRPQTTAQLTAEPAPEPAAAPRARRFARRPKAVGSAVPAEPIAKRHSPAAADRAAPKPEAPKPAPPRQAPARAASLKLAPAPLPEPRAAEPEPATPAEPAEPPERAVEPTEPPSRRNAKRAAKPAPQPSATPAAPAAKRLAPVDAPVARVAEPQPAEPAPQPDEPVAPAPLPVEPAPQPVEPVAPAPPPIAPAPPPQPVAPAPVHRPAAVPGAGAELCRIRLRQGSSQSRFFAERPEGGPPLARSAPFRLRGGKSPEDRETVKAALGGLLAELEAEGWHAVGRGRAPWEVELRRYL